MTIALFQDGMIMEFVENVERGLKKMRCCHCNKQIMQEEINKNLAHELMGQHSHKSCDEMYFERQEKLIKYLNKKLIDTESI